MSSTLTKCLAQPAGNQIQHFVDTISEMKQKIDAGEHIPNLTPEDEQQIIIATPCILHIYKRRLDNQGWMNYGDKRLLSRYVRLFHKKDALTFPMPFLNSYNIY